MQQRNFWRNSCLVLLCASAISACGGNTSTTSSSSSSSTSSSSSASSASSSSTSSASSSSSSGALSKYCPSNEPCRILPIGDSITDGLGVSGGGGYRIELFRLAVEAGYDITFVGSFTNGPATVAGQPFPRKHEGVSGETISQIHNRLRTQALRENPHIILLHAGTNDMWAGASGAPNRLASLIDDIFTRAPNALLVVSNIIPWPQQSTLVNQYNSQIQPLIDQRINEGKNIVFVDQFTGFPSSELADGIHPNARGYERMAAKWFNAIYEHLVDVK